MKTTAKALLGALLLAGASFTSASAQIDVGISFGSDVPYGFDPCDYYDYYNEPPPWGLPDDYCDYPVYFEPVYFDGYWYQGPIYYRWYHGKRKYWLHGGWREDGWHGSRPAHITWRSHSGGYRRGGGVDYRHGSDHWRDRWHGGVGGGQWRDRDNDRGHGNGDRPWLGHRGDDRPHDGRFEGGDRRDHGGGGHFNGGGDHGGGHFNGGGGDHGGGGHFNGGGGDHGGGGHFSGGGDHGGGGHH